MRTRYLNIGITLLMLTGLVSYATAETRNLKCTFSGSFTDGVETHIDTNGDGASATLDEGFIKCNGSSALFQEESEAIPQPTVTTCPNVSGMIEFHISQTQGQQRVISTDLKTGDQTFGQQTAKTLCLNSATGLFTGTSQGIYLGGTGKLTGVTGTFSSQFSGSYLIGGVKDGIFGGFGQFTGTAEATQILSHDTNGKED